MLPGLRCKATCHAGRPAGKRARSPIQGARAQQSAGPAPARHLWVLLPACALSPGALSRWPAPRLADLPPLSTPADTRKDTPLSCGCRSWWPRQDPGLGGLPLQAPRPRAAGMPQPRARRGGLGPHVTAPPSPGPLPPQAGPRWPFLGTRKEGRDEGGDKRRGPSVDTAQPAPRPRWASGRPCHRQPADLLASLGFVCLLRPEQCHRVWELWDQAVGCSQHRGATTGQLPAGAREGTRAEDWGPAAGRREGWPPGDGAMSLPTAVDMATPPCAPTSPQLWFLPASCCCPHSGRGQGWGGHSEAETTVSLERSHKEPAQGCREEAHRGRRGPVRLSRAIAGHSRRTAAPSWPSAALQAGPRLGPSAAGLHVPFWQTRKL